MSQKLKFLIAKCSPVHHWELPRCHSWHSTFPKNFDHHLPRSPISMTSLMNNHCLLSMQIHRNSIGFSPRFALCVAVQRVGRAVASGMLTSDIMRALRPASRRCPARCGVGRRSSDDGRSHGILGEKFAPLPGHGKRVAPPRTPAQPSPRPPIIPINRAFVSIQSVASRRIPLSVGRKRKYGPSKRPTQILQPRAMVERIMGF